MMQRFLNDPDDVVDETVRGFVKAHGAQVHPPLENDREAPAALTEALRAALAAQQGLGDTPALDFRSTPSIRCASVRSGQSPMEPQ